MCIHVYVIRVYVDVLCGQGREEENVRRQRKGEKKRHNNGITS